MKNEDINDKKLSLLAENLELPVSAYESAKRRYDDLGKWVGRAQSAIAPNDPHIFVQGSFALGTAIRPLLEGEEYDLDLSCKLRAGIGRTSHSQKQLKTMVGVELEAYRQARRIEEELEEKHRCWRLKYQDELQFHMDVVPGIPVEGARRSELSLLMEQRGIDRRLATDLAADAMWITDDRSRSYALIDPAWQTSNPEGYVRWFRSRVEGNDRALKLEAQVDEVPLFRNKTPLQRVVQLLKRHRDVMFEKEPDVRPVSVIITTLAGHAHVRGQSLEASMCTILAAMTAFRQSDSNEVPNPVNPNENFADRWTRPECAHLQLKRNFHLWIDQACNDFNYILATTEPTRIAEHASTRLRVRPSDAQLATALGSALSPNAQDSTTHRVEIASQPARPWRR